MDKQTLQKKAEEINRILERFLPEKGRHDQLIVESMGYSVRAGGKRLRPILMKTSFHVFPDGKEETEMLHRFMAAIECIHTYSLCHDDLPAMDNDEYRRGRKTTHVVYGEAMGILAGDALLNYAFETAAKAFTMFPDKSLQIGKAMQVLAGKAGIYGMIGGQVVDVTSVGMSVSKDKLDFIYELKTSALIECAMMIGAILAGAGDSDVKKVELIAKNVGLAFQIQDDILDVTSTVEVLGKPVLSDEKNEKTTYVTLVGLENAKKYVEQISNDAIVALQEFEAKNPFLEELLRQLIHREK